jgi:hypothetical protein
MVAELLALRREINDHSRRQGQLLMLSAVLFVATELFSLNSSSRESKRSALIYPIISTFIAELCYDSGAAIQLLAQYIEDRLEPKLPGTGWEKWLTSSGVNDPIVSRRLHRAESFFVTTQCASIVLYAAGAFGRFCNDDKKAADFMAIILFTTAVLATLRTIGHDVPLRSDAKDIAQVKVAFDELMGRVGFGKQEE